MKFADRITVIYEGEIADHLFKLHERLEKLGFKIVAQRTMHGETVVEMPPEKKNRWEVV